MIVTTGIDIGQRRDPTAIAVTELQWREPPKGRNLPFEAIDHHVVRFLQRLPLGTDYPSIAMRLKQVDDRLRDLVLAASLRYHTGDLVPDEAVQFKVFMDATGVGQPVVDMVRSAGVKVVGVYFTSGDRRIEGRDPFNNEPMIRLGKSYMVARLQSLLQTGRLHLPDTLEAEALSKELLDYEIKVSEDASEKLGVFKTGSHDDLVTALGLSVCGRLVKLQTNMGSTPGHTPDAVPTWAGGFTEQRLPGPGLGQSQLEQFMKLFPGLGNDPFRGY